MSEVIDRDITRWLQSFSPSTDVESNVKINQPKILCFILQLSGRRISLNVSHTKIKKNGQFGKATGANVLQLLIKQPAYLTVDDMGILASLNLGQRANTPIDLHNISLGKGLLRAVLATGRCFLDSTDSRPLSLGSAINIDLEWAMNADGSQILNTQNINLLPFVLDTPMYLDASNFTVGEIQTNVDPHILKNLLLAPPLAPNAVEYVHKRLTTVKSALLPKIITDIKQECPTPKMRLSVFGIYAAYFYGLRTAAPDPFPCLSVEFKYLDKIIDIADDTKSFYKNQDGSVREIIRDFAAEQQLLEKLVQVTNLVQLGQVHAKYTCMQRVFDPSIWNYFTLFNLSKPNFNNIEREWHDCLDKIRAEGWDIIFDESFPYRVIHEIEDWFASLSEDANDWFSVTLGIKVNGNKIDLLPILQCMLKDKYIFEGLEGIGEKDLPITLPDGLIITIAAGRLKMMLSFVKELFDRHGDDQIKLNKEDAVDFLEFSAATQALGLRWLGESKLQKIGEKLKNFQGLQPALIPETFLAELRSYQKEGVSWLQFLREYNLAGILADDMGLGKTVQTLAHIAIEKEAGRLANKPCIVIAPTSVLPNWLLEAKRFTPHLKVVALRSGMERKSIIENLDNTDIVLSTYALVLRDKAALLKHKFHTIILDEAQFIKNSKAKVTQVINQLHADHRLCLTGTPLENNLGELWSLFNFLIPGFLGTEQVFNRVYRHKIEKMQDIATGQALIRRIRPFIVRRTKDKVATELPDKTEIIQMCELDAEQADLYETIRVSMHDKVTKEIAKKGLAQSHILLLDALLKLRQVCCHPQLLTKMAVAKDIKTSVKLDQLMVMMPEMIEEGRKIVLFSQFTSMLALIEEALSNVQISFVKIIGSTKDRLSPIEEFQNGKVQVILISLKAGGTGINLTAADTVIHFDPWWNPAVEQQATDRVYRIGQDKPVFVYKMLTAGTVEEKIIAMQRKKASLAASIFDPEQRAYTNLRPEDIESLFEPLTA